MIFPSKKKKKKEAVFFSVPGGFSLPEVLVALFVASFGILTIVNFFHFSLNNLLDARNQVIAAELAQEGLELVRNFRDDKVAAGSSGNQVFEKMPSDNRDCFIDYKSSETDEVKCSSGLDKDKLYIKDGSYTHTSDGAQATKFRRKIKFTYCENTSCSLTASDRNNAVAVKVESFVTWRTSFPAECNQSNRCYRAESTLYAP